jgi:alpha-N-arabinofuranosidase
MSARIAALLLTLIGCAAAPPGPEKPRIMVRDRVLHRIDDKLFGHFLERPSWGETGIEGGLVPGTRDLQPGVLERLRRMRIPILRFPGGTDVDYIDWRDMVDNVPGREGPRPATVGHQGHRVTNNFGYDEFLRLCEDLKCEPLLVVNLGDALLRKKPVKEAALHAAGLLAYCAAPVGAALPEGMPDWPRVRARNGREKPWAVRYFQIGNETWFFPEKMKKNKEADVDGFYVECLSACVEAARAVDPSVRIVADAVSPRIAGLIRERLGDRVHYLVEHHYMPWAIRAVQKEGKDYPADKLTDEEVWNAWVAVPNSVNERGESVIGGLSLSEARKGGFRAALTEWNWNGWWALPKDAPRPLSSSLAKGVGAAGYLHAFMRSGDAIGMACQSMTVGHSWGITCIHADKEGRIPPYYMPSGQATMLYSAHHGDEFLETSTEGLPVYEQPYRMGGIAPRKKVAVLDVVATRGPKAVYVHAINRSFGEPLTVTLDLSAFRDLEGRAVLHVLEGRLNDEPREGESREIGTVTDREVRFQGNALEVTFPNRSVSVVEIARR